MKSRVSNRSARAPFSKAVSGVNLIAAIVNTEKIFSAEVKIPRLAVVYGSPVNFTGSPKDKEALAAFAQNLMNEIARLKSLGESSI